MNVKKDLDKIAVSVRNYLGDISDEVKYRYFQALPTHHRLGIIDIKISYDKTNNTYFVQSIDYPEIYTAADSLKQLMDSFHGVAHSRFGNPRFTTRHDEFWFQLSPKMQEKLHADGEIVIRNFQKKLYAESYR